jgi:hypothetical protein
MLFVLLLCAQWTKEPGVRVAEGAVPCVVPLGDSAYRLYYSGAGGIFSAVSTDGLDFTSDSGVRITQGDSAEFIVADPAVVRISDGYRMYYKGATGMGGPGQARHRIFSAISSDGLSWTKEGLRYSNLGSPDYGWTSVPDAIILPDGRVRIYYVSGTGGIRSIISNDGLSFALEDGVRLPCVDPNITWLPDSSFRLFFSTAVGLPQHIGYADSPDGLNFTIIDTILDPGGPHDSLQCLDPSAIRLSDGRTRVYYGGMNRSAMVTLSAISPGGGLSELPESHPGLRALPNPASGRVAFVRSTAGRVQRLAILNAAGMSVGAMALTGTRTEWDCRDRPGRPLPSGIYFAVVEGETRPYRCRFVLSR